MLKLVLVHFQTNGVVAETCTFLFEAFCGKPLFFGRPYYV